MKIIYVSNFINHYHVPISDELYKLTDGNYRFVETQPLPASFKKGGFSEYDKPYIIHAYESPEERERAMRLCEEADVMIAGGGKFILPYQRRRLRLHKLTFESAERIMKRGLINAISPTNVLTQLHYHLWFYREPLYKLCISGFTANDMYIQHSFKDKCYKYAYFPAIPKLDIDKVMAEKDKNEHLKMIWCARFIKWKHPELAVQLAERLRDEGYDFEINMIGSGELHPAIEKMIGEKNLGQHVHLLGNYPNAEVLKIMEQHDIFLFTSGCHEGWGVVLNEAMGRLCCPVASDMIGATPFLLRDKENGMVFRSEDIDSLHDKVKHLLDNPTEIRQMARQAYQDISTLWSPEEGARRLYHFSEAMLQGKPMVYESGPFSKAEPTPNYHFKLFA